MTLRDFFKNLITKSGIGADSEEAANFLSLPNLDAEISDALGTGIDNNLISMTAAKNNHSEIKNHYKSQTLDTVDTILNRIIEDFGIDDLTKNEVLSEKETYKRIPLLAKKLRELEAKKHEATNKTDKTSLQKEIDDLRAQLRLRDNEKTAMRSDFDKQVKDIKIKVAIDQILNKYQTILDNTIDQDVKTETLRNLLYKDFTETGVNPDFAESGQLQLLRTDGGNYYGENNQLVSLPQFAEKMLSRNKLLVVTPPNGQKPQNASAASSQNGQPTYQDAMRRQQQQQAQGNTAATSPGSNTLQALNLEQLRALEEGAKLNVM